MKSYTPLVVVVVGLVLIALGLLAQQIMPMLGRAAWQSAAAGGFSPSDYRLNLIGYYLVSALIIVLGLAAQYLDWKNP